MNIIKQNPFRVLGLLGNATEKELQRQIGIIKRYAEVGKSKSFDYDFEFIGTLTRNFEEVQEASNKIEQAHKKLLYSLFWFVKNNSIDEIVFNYLKENDTEKAIELWEKTLKDEVTNKNYSSYLNLSTLDIALSITNDQIDFQKLQLGISLKGKLINSESLNDFSKLVTGDGIAKDPIEISKRFADEVVELLKPYLNINNGISTSDLISLFNRFPSTIQKYILSKFTEVPISAIENKVEETIRKRKVNPLRADKYGQDLFSSTKTNINLLKNIIGVSNVQFQMLSEKVANEILQCSIDFINEQEENDNNDNFETNLNTAIKLAKLADSLAIHGQLKERAKESIKSLVEMKDRELLQAVVLLQSIKDAYQSKEADIRREVKAQENSLSYDRVINWVRVDEFIRNSLDWDKVVNLIHKIIPRTNLEKIKNSKNDTKLKQFKDLVLYLLGKISSSNKKQVTYLYYWKIVRTNTATHLSTPKHTNAAKHLSTPKHTNAAKHPNTTTHTSATSHTDNPSSDSSTEKVSSYLPNVIVGITGGLIGSLAYGFLGFFVGAVIGVLVYSLIDKK